jgi:dTMP kinase
MEPRPLFIVVDGLDGCGKSTLVDGICKELSKVDSQHLKTMEPSTSKVGAFIRNMLHTQAQQQTFEDREMLGNRVVMAQLFAADRTLHSKVIEHALGEGKHVVCDRWLLSSLVYQCGCESGADPELHRCFSKILSVNADVLDHVFPDLIVHLRVPHKVAFDRIQKTRGNWGRTFFEGEDASRMRRDEVIWDRAMLYYHDVFNRPILVLDGTRQPFDLVNDVMRELVNQHSWFPRIPRRSE